MCQMQDSPTPTRNLFHVSRDFHPRPYVPFFGCVNIYPAFLWKLYIGERAADIKATAVYVLLTSSTSAAGRPRWWGSPSGGRRSSLFSWSLHAMEPSPSGFPGPLDGWDSFQIAPLGSPTHPPPTYLLLLDLLLGGGDGGVWRDGGMLWMRGS